MRKRERKRQGERRRNSRSILERLSSGFLQSFRRKHVKKWCTKEVPGVSGTLEKPTAILTQPKRDWGPHHHVKAAVDWWSSLSLPGLSIYSFTIPEALQICHHWPGHVPIFRNGRVEADDTTPNLK